MLVSGGSHLSCRWFRAHLVKEHPVDVINQCLMEQTYLRRKQIHLQSIDTHSWSYICWIKRSTDDEHIFWLRSVTRASQKLIPVFTAGDIKHSFMPERLRQCSLRCHNPRKLQDVITWLYYTILYYTILYYTILYYIILYYIILYYIILYITTLHYTMLYYMLQYITTLYNTLLYYAIQYVTTIRYYTKLYYMWCHVPILYYTTLCCPLCGVT